MAGDRFLVMWCNEGLEALINITAAEKQAVVEVLNGKKPTFQNPIQYMILRARYNPQRFYEIYVFDSEIEECSIRSMFEDQPQTIVDAIRRVGDKIYSEPKPKQPVIV